MLDKNHTIFFALSSTGIIVAGFAGDLRPDLTNNHFA
jgi:hypothetical protein